MSNQKVAIIKTSTTLHIRQKISGELNKISLVARRTSPVELLRRYVTELEEGKDSQEAWDNALDKCGLRTKMRQEARDAMRENTKKNPPDNEQVVCP